MLNKFNLLNLTLFLGNIQLHHCHYKLGKIHKLVFQKLRAQVVTFLYLSFNASNSDNFLTVSLSSIDPQVTFTKKPQLEIKFSREKEGYLIRVGKNLSFFKKKKPSDVYWVLLFFLGFYWFFFFTFLGFSI